MKFVAFIFLLLSFTVFAQEGRDAKLSIEQCLALADKYKEAGDQKEATRYLNTAAIVFWENKNYSDAIKYFNESIELNNQINNASGVSKIHSNLGMIYSDMGQYETSLEYFNKSLEYRKKYGDKTEKISTLINISVVLNNLKRYTDAVANLEESLRMATEMNDASQMKSCYGMLAETYEKAGNQERAMHYFNLYKTFHEMLQRNKVNEAKKEVESARLQALQLELKNKEDEVQLMRANEELALSEAELKKLDTRARTLLEKNSKQQLAINLMESELELDRAKLLQVQKDNDQQKLELGLIVVVLVAVVSLLIIVYRNGRYRKKMNLLLGEQNEEITALNENLEQEVVKRTNDLQHTLVKLKKRNEDLDQFSHIISHNLRGPVASILGLGNVINRNNPSDKVNVEVFDRLQLSTHKLDGIVKDLSVILDVRDNQAVISEYVEFDKILNSALTQLNGNIEKSTAKIESDFSNAKSVQSVKAYLESILFNLISNAIQYRSPSREPVIYVTTSSNGSDIILSVKDNGVGINDGDEEKIFEPYRRLHSQSNGKGLGLYLVKTQVEALNGSIEVTSEPGKGSTFSIRIPSGN